MKFTVCLWGTKLVLVSPDAYVDTQNFRYWAKETLQQRIINRYTMRKSQCVVQYNILRKINWIFFSYEGKEKATAVTSSFFKTFFMQELTQCPKLYYNAWRHQEGTCLHTAIYSANALNQSFLNHVIRRNGQSSDLSSFDRFRAEGLPKEPSLRLWPTKCCRTEVERIWHKNRWSSSALFRVAWRKMCAQGNGILRVIVEVTLKTSFKKRCFII